MISCDVPNTVARKRFYRSSMEACLHALTRKKTNRPCYFTLSASIIVDTAGSEEKYVFFSFGRGRPSVHLSFLLLLPLLLVSFLPSFLLSFCCCTILSCTRMLPVVCRCGQKRGKERNGKGKGKGRDMCAGMVRSPRPHPPGENYFIV